MLEKSVGFILHCVLLFSHREWGQPAGTTDCTTSPSDMTVSNWLDLEKWSTFSNPQLIPLYLNKDARDPGVEDFSEPVQVCQHLNQLHLH